MKKVLMSLMIIALVSALIGGGIYAVFSDVESSTGNTFTAGTLNLVNVISGTAVNSSIAVTEQADGLNDKVEFGLTNPIRPGSSGTITWTLSNTGNLPGTLTMAAITSFGEGAAANEPELAADPTNLVGLDTNLMVWVTRDGADVYGATGAYAPMSGLAGALNAQSPTIGAGGSVVYVLNWQIPLATGNAIQGDTATLDINFTLTQQ
ncbi:MAG TPA: TasA family protein [Dehalococcoidales bacterium]